MQITSRKQAIDSGYAKYFTGKPCNRGHVSERRTGSGACLMCSAENLIKWRANNPDRNLELGRINSKDRYEKKKEEIKERNRIWQKTHRAQLNAKQRENYRKDGESIRLSNREWRNRNIDKAKAIEKQSRIKHRDAYNERNRRRQAAQLLRVPPWSDRKKCREIYAECARITAETGVLHHVDHVIPLQGKKVSGLHVHENLQILTAIDNVKKANKFTEIESGYAFECLLCK